MPLGPSRRFSASNSQVALYNPRSLQATGGGDPAAAASTNGQQPFDLEVPLASADTQAEGGTGDKRYTGYVFGVIIAVILILLAFALCIICVKRRGRKKSVETNEVLISSTGTQQDHPQQQTQFAPAGPYGSPQVVN